MSIIGLMQINNRGERGKGLAIAGIVVSAISLLYTFFVLVFVALF